MNNRNTAIDALERDWSDNPRWRGVTRNYGAAAVVRLRGSVQIEHTLARLGAEKLWRRVNTEDFVPTLSALIGGQAVQQVKAGIKAIYLSGWQMAADANVSDNMYPDQSLYPVNSVPAVVRSINNALMHSNVPMKYRLPAAVATLIISFQLSLTQRPVLAAY